MWEPLMGVGKLPQVTADVSTINPFSLVFDDATQLIVPSSTLGSGYVQAGALVNVYNSQFDYTAVDPFYISQTGGGTNVQSTLLFDLGKSLSMRGVFLYWVASSVSGTNTMQIQYSDDGSNWTTAETFTISGSSVETSRTFTSLQFRYFRLLFNTTAGGPGQTLGFIFRRMEMRINPNQLVR